MKFYSLVKKDFVVVPDSQVRQVVKKVNGVNRLYAIGKYKYKGKEYEAWKALGLAKKR